ncbi:MAG: hypothetical protein RLZZ81_957 [Pseudomonadota bacterium]|jgi:general stress protein YciG
MTNNNKGFASMDKEKVREIAAKGGHASHGGGRHSHEDHDDGKSGKQGFASMPKEQVREIATKGGHASHKGSH